MRRIDFVQCFVVLGLVVFSSLFVYSSSLDIEGVMQSVEFSRQLLFVIIGFICMFITMLIPISKVKEFIPVIYALALALLVLTLFIGEVRNGARSWLQAFGFSLQASEFAKLATILMYAFLIEKYTPHLQRYRYVLLYVLVGFAPMALILLQPDMGTSLVYIPLVLAILYIAGIPAERALFVIGAGVISIVTLIVSYSLQSIVASDPTAITLLRTEHFVTYVIILVIVFMLSAFGTLIGFLPRIFATLRYCSFMTLSGAAMAFVATIVLKPYQLQRLLVFVRPESDPLGSGWHILQSVSAIGSGGLLGAGFLQGKQSSLQFLPQKSTDFIFSLIGEEFGFVGSASVILLYGILMWRIILVGMASKTMFSRLCCAGILAVFFTHFMVNIGMTLGIMPITGIPLLLVSYGGSSMLSAFLALGVVQGIYRHEVRNSSLMTSAAFSE